MNTLKAQVDIGDTFGINFGFDPMSTATPPQTLGEFVNRMIPQIYTIALLLVFIYLIWGGYRWLVSAGDPKAIQAAKGHLTWAVAGMIIIFLSYWMYQALSFVLLQTF